MASVMRYQDGVKFYWKDEDTQDEPPTAPRFTSVELTLYKFRTIKWWELLLTWAIAEVGNLMILFFGRSRDNV